MPRERLLDRLDNGLENRLTLVSAPPGSGKTTLVSQWAARSRQGVQIAWVLLDEQDNDPISFWSYVIAALECVCPRVGDGARPLLHALSSPGAPGGPGSAGRLLGVVTQLVNRLAAIQAVSPGAPPLMLVLDDYHAIHTPAVHGSLAAFLDYLPPHAHLALLTRTDPSLPLARLRARGQMIELGAADLRFSPDEVAAFLGSTIRGPLRAGTVSALASRTEGWAVGLQLAALALRGLAPQQVDELVGSLGGSHRTILSYMTEEVVLRQPAELQEFMLRTSVLPYLTAPLCDALTGGQRGQALLEQMTARNLFTTPLDTDGRWFRYHPLFAEALLARLQVVSPELEPELHRRAALWHQQRGTIAQAFPHALASGDLDFAATLIENGYKQLAMRGQLVSLHKWLNSLPPDLVRARPRLCLAQALALAYSGTREQVESWLRLAESARAAGPPSATAEDVSAELAAFQAVFASVNWPGATALALARRAVRLLPRTRTSEELWLRVLTLQALGNCHRLLGNVRQAVKTYGAVLSTTAELDSPFLTLAVNNRLGQTQMLQGRLCRAARTFRDALSQAEGQGGEMHWFAGELHAHLARIFTEWNKLEQAQTHAARSIELGCRAENRHALMEGHLALATVLAARRDADGALETLEQARRLVADASVPYLAESVTAQQAWLGLAPGNGRLLTPEVNDWLAALQTHHRGPQRDRLPLILREFQDLILARAWLKHGQALEATHLLSTLVEGAHRGGRRQTEIPAMALESLGMWMLGNLAGARAAVLRALTLGEPESFVRTFLDLGEPMRELILVARVDLLESCSAPEPLLRYVNGLVSACSHAFPPLPVVQEALTPRELDILRLIATGASNHQIAERLVVTVGTVKGHVNHLLDKLDVPNRTAAVARARELGLLPA